MSLLKYDDIVSVPAEELGRPNLNPPTVVDQDNLTLYAFTVDTDKMTFKLPVPQQYNSGDLEFWVIWTNDGGIDDNGRNVKWQIDYQVATEGDAVSGSHGNSPKSVENTYVGAAGWIEHHTAHMTIAEADFAGKFCIYIKLSAVTPVGAALTCDPHLIGLCFLYTRQHEHILYYLGA